LAGNNYPTITYLKDNLWKQAFQDSLLDPAFLQVAIAYAEVTADILGKEAAGYPTTFTDPWGRLLSYQLLSGSDGGASTTLSSVAGLSSFTSYSVPYAVITSLGTKVWLGECETGPNATTYEFTPYEFGSWDSDVSAFTPTKYLGTAMSGRKPIGSCTTNYDNLGYIFGTSSNLFNQICFDVPVPENASTNLDSTLAQS
jgi:lysophospholipase